MRQPIKCKNCRYYQPIEEMVIEIPICLRLWTNTKPGNAISGGFDYLMVGPDDGCTFGERGEKIGI